MAVTMKHTSYVLTCMYTLAIYVYAFTYSLDNFTITLDLNANIENQTDSYFSTSLGRITLLSSSVHHYITLYIIYIRMSNSFDLILKIYSP